MKMLITFFIFIPIISSKKLYFSLILYCKFVIQYFQYKMQALGVTVDRILFFHRSEIKFGMRRSVNGRRHSFYFRNIIKEAA